MLNLFSHLRQNKEKRERILALDLLRGVFLLEIIIAHIAWHPSFFTFIGGGNQLPASAAEGFFTISGLLVGYLYGPRVLKDRKNIFAKIWKRAFLLYCLATFFTFFYTAWATLDPTTPVYQTIYAREPWRFIVDTLTLRYAFGWAEFLNRYALFMLFAPFVVRLVAKGRAWIVAIVSFTIWLLLREVDRFLPFSAWQLVFMFGIVIGYYLPHLEQWFRSHSRSLRDSVFAIICLVALGSYIFSLFLFIAAPITLPPDSALVELRNQLVPYFDKNHLAPARVAVGAVWFTALYMSFRRYEKQIAKYTHGVLEVLGKQSLFVYSLHAFILFIIDLYFIPMPGHTVLQNTLVTVAVLEIIYIAALNRDDLVNYGRQLINRQ